MLILFSYMKTLIFKTRASFYMRYLWMVLVLLQANLGYSQKSEWCENIYVWEFSPISGERDRITRVLTDQVEEIFTQIGTCTILDRNRDAILMDRVEHEKAIQRSSQIPQDINRLLKVQLAERILFGEVHAEYGGNILLRLTIDHLATRQILISKSIYLEGNEASNPRERETVLRQFLEEMLGVTPSVPSPPPTRLPTPIRNFQANHQSYYLSVGSALRGQVRAKISNLSIKDGNYMTFNYSHENGVASGTFDQNGVFTGNFSSIGGGRFQMRFNPDGTSHGSWSSSFGLGGDFSIVK